jgi:vacuolar-type H+-ATPase catalytic subunit A/Vma1
MPLNVRKITRFWYEKQNCYNDADDYCEFIRILEICEITQNVANKYKESDYKWFYVIMKTMTFFYNS